MAKIVLSLNGVVLQEASLSNGKIRIGRHPHNDMVIESRAISGEHAMVEVRGSDVVLEDLNSTNGTQVNGQPVKKHFLQDRDVVELAKYKLQYLAEKPLATVKKPAAVPAGAAAVKILTGANSGKQLLLSKPLTTLGRPGIAVAVIAQRADGYYLTHVEGAQPPTINGISIGKEAQMLMDGDVIDVSGTQMGFACPKT